MPEIIRTLTQPQPACCFIGKRFDPAVWSSLPAMWGTFWENGWFGQLETLQTPEWTKNFPDMDAYIGLEELRDGSSMPSYLVGLFAPADAVVPEGFEKIEFAACRLAVAYIYGPESAVYGFEGECLKVFAEKGLVPRRDNGVWWMFERYACPRFTTPDEQGHVILDICCVVE